MDFVTFQFQIMYETNPGEELFIYGDSPDFGSWRHPKFKLRWSPGHVWKADYEMQKSSKITLYKRKIVCYNPITRLRGGSTRDICQGLILPKWRSRSFGNTGSCRKHRRSLQHSFSCHCFRRRRFKACRSCTGSFRGFKPRTCQTSCRRQDRNSGIKR